MNRFILLFVLLGCVLFGAPSSEAALEPSVQNVGYWVGITQPDADKRYSMSNVFRGQPCVEYERQMTEYFYRSTGASRRDKIDILCRGGRNEAENIRKTAIRSHGEPTTAWKVPDVPDLK